MKFKQYIYESIADEQDEEEEEPLTVRKTSGTESCPNFVLTHGKKEIRLSVCHTNSGYALQSSSDIDSLEYYADKKYYNPLLRVFKKIDDIMGTTRPKKQTWYTGNTVSAYGKKINAFLIALNIFLKRKPYVPEK